MPGLLRKRFRRDVDRVMETAGVKKGQAYNLTKAVRKEKKAQRDARILELYSAGGMSQRDIAKEVGVSRGTVSRVLKNMDGAGL